MSTFVAVAAGAYAAVVGSVILYSGSIGFPVGASLISAGVAVVTGMIALLKDTIMDTITRPRLALRFFPHDKRDCHATAFRDRNTGSLLGKTHYFRLRVENVGWRTAEDVEVSLEAVNRFENGRFLLDTDFMPLRLYWSHWRETRYEISIPPGAYRHCDFGFVIEPTAKTGTLPPKENGNLLFWFDVFLRPNTGPNNSDWTSTMAASRSASSSYSTRRNDPLFDQIRVIRSLTLPVGTYPTAENLF